MKPSGKASQASQASHKRAKSVKSGDDNQSLANESMDDADIAEALKSEEGKNESSLGA